MMADSARSERRTGRTVEEAARYVFDELHRDEA
jgi:hypothetical protein